MRRHKRPFTLVVFLIITLILTLDTKTIAYSVYAIPDQHDDSLNVYDTSENGSLDYRASYDLRYIRPVDVTIDTKSNTLFVTSEFQNDIELINAWTFLSEGIVTADGASNLTGVVIHQVDPNTTRLYTVDRGTDKLFVYDWDAEAKELTLLPYSPTQDWYTLLPQDPESDPDITAYGLSFDPVSDRLYVSQYSNIVYAYDPNASSPDPNDQFRFTRKINLGSGNKAMDIDVDSANGWLYAGGYQSHRNLIRHGLNDSNNNHVEEIVETGMGGVIGLAVSQGTNMVYMTTYNQELEAWDTNTWTQIDAENISNGAGVCVAEEGYVPPFGAKKVDDVLGCSSPRGQEIKYTIRVDYQWVEFGYTDPNIIDSIEVVDYLPAEVNFVSALPNDGLYEYDEPDGPRYTWTLTDSNSFADTLSFELVVESQNERMTPGGMIENNVKVIAIINEGEHFSKFTLQTPVCDCRNYTEVLYVDDAAAPSGNGQTWGTAFKYLQDALSVALPCDEIWVADGTYKPTNGSDPNFTFELVNGVGVYGGFEGGEEHRYDRDWGDPCKTAILSGDIQGDDDSYYVVISDYNVEVGCLDGFTIKDGNIAGIYCERSSPAFQHNKITTSGTGVYCFESEQPVIKNNWIYENDNGIYFDEPSDTPIVRNNTIADNTYYGISASGIDPNINISNCIIWGNGTQLNLDFVPTYSCIQNWTQGGTGNISSDPCFVSAGTDDYHLDPCSACIDAGDPCANYGSERDIDKHFRVLNKDGENYNKRVDIGADEYCNQGSSNDADFNKDGIVNYIDFSKFGAAWMDEPGDPNWEDGKYDLNSDGIIVDVNDLVIFAEEWLWASCEDMKVIPMMEMMMGMGKMMGMESMLTSETTMLSPTTQQISKTQPEPSIEEQIEQIKELLDWLYEIKDQVDDEEAWLGMVTSLEEMLKELEDSQ